MLLKRAAFVVAITCAFAPHIAHADVRTCIDAHERSNQLRKSKALRAARAELLVCAADACPPDIRSECANEVVAVTAAIPTLVISMQDSAKSDLVDARVTIDGAIVATRLDGNAISLDPGPHEIEVLARGEAMHQSVVMREGEKDRRLAFSIAPAPLVRTRDQGRRTIGLVTGAVGLAGLGFGVVSTIIAASLWSQSRSECHDSACGSVAYARALGDRDSAKDWANVSTASFVAGGIVLAVGGVLFFTAPWVLPGTSAGLTFGARL